MDVDVVRLMIRRRVVERRLPHERMASVESTPGGGQMCDACGANITPDHMAMIGAPSTGGRPRHFHALCFRIWDNERHLLYWLRDVARAEGAHSASEPSSMDIKCPLCQQVISPDDTVGFVGYGMAHVDCGRPRSLSPEEHVLLYVYCWDHPVAECVACAQSFRQKDLGSDPFGSHTYGCLYCGADLTESMRTHLTACAMLPEQLRQRVKMAREVTQRLIKRSYQLSDRTDVLMREVEAALDELNETRKRARGNRDER